jgi:DNA-binding PadR family transcriptional regulator
MDRYAGRMANPTRIRMTRTTLKVLEVLLDSAGTEVHPHGLWICDQSGLGTGTVYPILARLEREEWLAAQWEPEADWQNLPPGKRRPRRRLYELTGTGRELAAAALKARDNAARQRTARNSPTLRTT